MKIVNTTTFFQVIGWYPNIKPSHRRPATLSDGAMFSTRELAEQYVQRKNITLLRIQKHCRAISDVQLQHIDCFLKPPYTEAISGASSFKPLPDVYAGTINTERKHSI